MKTFELENFLKLRFNKSSFLLKLIGSNDRLYFLKKNF